MLEQAEIEVASVPWDVSPTLRQEPTLNPFCGSGDVAPGTLLHSGEMSLEATAVSIPGRGFDFVFTRTCRSQTTVTGRLSRRGEGNLSEVRVTPGSAGANGSLAARGTGLECDKKTNQPRRSVDPRVATARIERSGVGLAERITRASGSEEAGATAYSYNAYGQPIEVVDPKLHRTTYEYFAD
ncbi:MAG: hypothetical protein GY856_07185, partial [bacterium]|nr:hypothetical protein [bacterium]